VPLDIINQIQLNLHVLLAKLANSHYLGQIPAYLVLKENINQKLLKALVFHVMLVLILRVPEIPYAMTAHMVVMLLLAGKGVAEHVWQVNLQLRGRLIVMIVQ
jgi:hypothetical protein